MTNKIYLHITLLALTQACASTAIQGEKLRGMGKVALVGYELIEEGPADLSLSGILTHQDSGGFAKAAVVKHEAHGVDVYKISTDVLRDDLKWNVLTYSQLVANPDYVEVYKDRMSGFRNLPTVPKNFAIQHAEGIMDWGAIERMEPAQRESLASKLGLGGIAIVSIRSEPQQTGMLGLVTGAKFKPQSTITIRVYGHDGTELLWNEAQIRGEYVEGDGHIAGGKENIERVNALINDSVRSAWKRAVEDYREAQPN